MNEDIQITREAALMSIRLNRPDKKNAITTAMYAAMADALEQAGEEPAIIAVTITGAGDMFTAGNDINDFLLARAAGPDLPVFRFLRAIASCPKVLVAGVRGSAIGIGTTMLLHCDLVLAAPGTRFAMPFVDLALVPEAASSMLLPRMIGRQRAAKHLILAEPFDVETALGYGLVTEIVAGEELDARVQETAQKIARKPPEAVLLTKKLLLSPDESVIERIEREGQLFDERLSSAEAKEAFTAFFEKRAPDFTRR
jgi:enoyl-CoA hydratase/carnithine racemase